MRASSVRKIVFTALGALLGTAPASLAQRGNDPNLGHFYMARQQVTITDEAPMVINRQGGGAGGPAAAGSMPAGPAPLPRAGWVPYSQSQPGFSTSLPKVNNGVPQQAPPPRSTGPAGMKGKARGLKTPAGGGTKTAAAKPPGNVVSSYAPYKTYPDPKSFNSSAPSSSSSNVKGRMLHWRPGGM